MQLIEYLAIAWKPYRAVLDAEARELLKSFFDPIKSKEVDVSAQAVLRELVGVASQLYQKDPIDFYDFFSESSSPYLCHDLCHDLWPAGAKKAFESILEALQHKLDPSRVKSMTSLADARIKGWDAEFLTPVPTIGVCAMLDKSEVEWLADRHDQMSLLLQTRGLHDFADKRPHELSQIERLAYLHICSSIYLRKTPYSTQMLTLLALTNEIFSRGRLAQVKTGEGKSLLVLFLAGFFLLEGKRVHIMTSGHDLAERDYAASREWFTALGFRSAILRDPLSNPEKRFDEPVLWGVSTDFEFLFLEGLLSPHKPPRFSVEYTVAIIDEVDNLWIDSVLSSAQISMPDPVDSSWVFPKILEAVREKKLEDLEILQKDFPARKISDWIESANRALHYKKEEDYVVENGEVVIVNKDLTGELQEGCRWGHGVHEFVEAKEGLRVQASSLLLASISHPVFFRLYPKIMGLSGSLGTKDDRAELFSVYGVPSFDVPPHRPSRFISSGLPMIAPDESAHQRILLDSLIAEAHRPVILLVLTIAECFRLKALIESDKRFQGETDRESPRLIQVYNEKQLEEKSFVLNRAGMAGVVTITTHIGGRGTDYRLKPETADIGFLLLYLFFPDNLRVETQGFGRVARQGEPGVGQYLLHPKSPGIPKIFQERTPDESFYHDLLLWREHRNKSQAQRRAEELKKSEREFERLCVFSQHLKDAVRERPESAGAIQSRLHLEFALGHRGL